MRNFSQVKVFVLFFFHMKCALVLLFFCKLFVSMPIQFWYYNNGLDNKQNRPHRDILLVIEIQDKINKLKKKINDIMCSYMRKELL